MHTATPTRKPRTDADTLALVRAHAAAEDHEALAAGLGCSLLFAAGLIDGVTGDDLFDGCFDWSEWPRHEYEDGIARAQRLLEEECYAAGWRECYAVAAREAAESIPVPAGTDDLPF